MDSDMDEDETPQSYPKYIPQIAYTDPPTPLQTLDLWLPRPLSHSDPQTTVILIYIHGGAWRDPTQDSSTIQPTLAHLLTTTHPLTHIAAIASLDYRLSPYPTHPTDPSLPDDPSRNATWPDHIEDVRRAVAFLRARYGVGGLGGRRWVGVGHSAGATLWAQFVGGLGLERGRGQHGDGDGDVDVDAGPVALVLVAGIYSLERLLANHRPPGCSPRVAGVYEEFVKGAFGGDGGGGRYAAVSPVAGGYREGVCPALRQVLLAWSPEDELIEAEQREVMLARLKEEGWVEKREQDSEARVVEAVNLSEGHDNVWQDGRQMAVLIGDVVGRMFGDS